MKRPEEDQCQQRGNNGYRFAQEQCHARTCLPGQPRPRPGAGTQARLVGLSNSRRSASPYHIKAPMLIPQNEGGVS